MFVYLYIFINFVRFGDLMFYGLLINVIILNLLYEFIEFLFPNKEIRDFVEFGVLMIFLLYFIEFIKEYL